MPLPADFVQRRGAGPAPGGPADARGPGGPRSPGADRGPAPTPRYTAGRHRDGRERAPTERIGDILGETRARTPEEPRAALQTQPILGGRIGTNLLGLGIVDERQLAAASTKAYGEPCLAGEIEPEEDAIAAVPAHLVERFGFGPLHVDDRRVRVVMADPRNLANLDDLAFATGKRVLAPPAAPAS